VRRTFSFEFIFHCSPPWDAKRHSSAVIAGNLAAHGVRSKSGYAVLGANQSPVFPLREPNKAAVSSAGIQCVLGQVRSACRSREGGGSTLSDRSRATPEGCHPG